LRIKGQGNWERNVKLVFRVIFVDIRRLDLFRLFTSNKTEMIIGRFYT